MKLTCKWCGVEKEVKISRLNNISMDFYKKGLWLCKECKEQILFEVMKDMTENADDYWEEEDD